MRRPLVAKSVFIVGVLLITRCNSAPREPTDPTLNSVSELGTWRMYGYDLGQTRFSPETALPPRGELAWSHAIPGTISSTPLVANGVVYVIGSGATIVALDAETGDEIWMTQLEATTFGQSLSLADDMLYAGIGETYDSFRLSGLDRFTGEVLWQHRTYGVQAPIVFQGLLYRLGLPRPGGETLVIEIRDAVTGKQFAEFPMDIASALFLVLEDRLLYVGSRGAVYAFDVDTGEEIWVAQMQEASLVGAMSAEGRLYIAETIGDVVALDAQTGQELWRFRDHRNVAWTEGAVAYGTVFATCTCGDIYALDAETGNMHWQFEAEGIIDAAPAVANGVIYFGTHFRSEPSKAHSDKGKVYALDAASGELIWVLDTPPVRYSPPSIVEGVLYVCTSTGEVLAIR